MLRKSVSGKMVLLLLIISQSTLAFNIQLVESLELPKREWTRTYGGTNYDDAYSMVQAGDGGYALAGYTSSFGAGGWDFWLVKTDVNGNTMWNKTYGGTGYEGSYSMVQAGDGGYALAGYTSSFGGGLDFWLVKTDVNGNTMWNKTYGGANSECAKSLVQTVDGGYALAGYTSSFGAGGWDFWLVKTDVNGNTMWNKTYGGTGEEMAFSLVQTVDGGYALLGWTMSFGAGLYDFWLVKTDVNGNTMWNKTYGGTGYESPHSLVQTVDEGYALAGDTNSFGAGGIDFWLVKIARTNSPPSAPVVDVTPDSPVTTDDLTCVIVAPSTDADGDFITYTYDWYKNDVWQFSGTSVSSSQTQKGELWKCIVTPNDGIVNGPAGEDQVAIDELRHDLAVTNVAPLETVIYQGYLSNISVEVENQGDFTETFNLTAYSNATVIETEEVSLLSGNSTTISFVWNSTGFAKGNYTLSANATLEGDVNTTDNTFTDGWIVITIPGDCDRDYNVDSIDLFTLAPAYGSEEGDPLYNPACDFDDDGDVDSIDLFTLAPNYGKPY